MDPYARVRVGHFVYETQTDPNGGKTPHWNRVIHSQLPNGVTTISIEIYDECSFKMDELVAWTDIKIPESVLRGETHEEWYTLSGKQGDFVEGMVYIVMSFTVSILRFYWKFPFNFFNDFSFLFEAWRRNSNIWVWCSASCNGTKCSWSHCSRICNTSATTTGTTAGC